MKRSPLTRKTPLRSRSRLRSRGARFEREAASLAAFRAEVRSRQWCELGPPACEPQRHEGHHAHHVVRKSQGGPNDPSNGLLTCWLGHAFVHANPAVSFERGWLRRRTP